LKRIKKHSPIRKNISQAKVLMVAQRMEIQKIGHVNIFHTKLIGIANVVRTASGIVIDFNSLDLKNQIKHRKIKKKNIAPRAMNFSSRDSNPLPCENQPLDSPQIECSYVPHVHQTLYSYK
jgi:hypothetical protein